MRSSTDGSIEAQSIENYDFQFYRSEIQPKLIYLFRVSFLTTPDIYIYIYIEREREREREREEKMGFCPFIKKNPAFCQNFQTN